MIPTSVGVLHPGAMGSTIGRTLRQNQHRVLWASAGRSAATRARAEQEGFVELPNLASLVAEASTIVSICPPHASQNVVKAAAGAGFDGTFIDANAITPSRSSEQRRQIVAQGGRYLDACVIGPPADEKGTTRLYLSGEGAGEVAALFEGGLLEAVALDGDDFAASTLKMVYAAYTKGSAALLLAVSTAAHQLGVDDDLKQEWSLSMPDLPERADRLLQYAGRKAWRFEEEMRNIAQTMAGAGLPDGFHLAAAEIYQRLSGQVAGAFPVEKNRSLSELAMPGAEPPASL